MAERSVLVAVENIPYTADILYEYKIGKTNAQPGHIVVFPFGKNNKKTRGVVFSYGENGKNKKLKSLSYLYCDDIYITEENILLAEFMKSKYFCTYFEAIKAILPPGVLSPLTKADKTGLKTRLEEYIYLSPIAENYKNDHKIQKFL